MRRVLCVWLPTFSTDLVKRRRRRAGLAASAEGDRRRPEAVMLTRPVASRELVVRRCEVAAAAGVAEGMDLAHARSLLPGRLGVHVEHHEAARDAARLEALACWGLRYSPVVAADEPDGLLIDITGTQRVHGGEAKLIRRVAKEVSRLGFGVRVAAAPTFACAWGVARYGRHDLSRVPPGREADAVRELPVAALRVEEEICRGLAEIGVTNIGELLRLPRASLAARFDGELLRRLRQALGQEGELIQPVRPVPPARAEMIFDGPTDHWESVEAAARRVLDDLVIELVKRGQGVRRLDVELRRARAGAIAWPIHFSRPTCAGKHLWSLLRAGLERADLHDGVEGVVLTASATGRLRHRQACSEGMGAAREAEQEAAWGELIDTLAGRLGSPNVVRIEPVESHLPERAYREQSVMERPNRGGAAQKLEAWRAGLKNADRPTVLFNPPEPAEAMSLVPDGPLLSVGWRGRRWTIAACAGPERIEQEWWRWSCRAEGAADQPVRARQARGGAPFAPPGRDYFAVLTECGRRLWMFCHLGTSRWFVHGEWA